MLVRDLVTAADDAKGGLFLFFAVKLLIAERNSPINRV
jgi:hypothetical protein